MGIAAKDFLLRIGDGGGPEVFTTIGQQRVTRLTINNSEVDITNKDSAGIRRLLPEASVRSFQMTVDGIFDDQAAAERLRAVAEAGVPKANFELIDATGDDYAGEFQISNFEMGGGHEESITFSATFANTGAVPRSAV